MKTLQECKDEVAYRYGCDGWKSIKQNFQFQITETKITRDELNDMASEMYAEQFKCKNIK